MDAQKTSQKMKNKEKELIDDKMDKKDRKKLTYILQYIFCNTTINLYDIFISTTL